ncbi:hypothetical protein [Mesorhizobium ventifaucium]|uniref:hypothetical protein n=1 Tax=Mesorhizobium ventifaucium TaxID=666020 RepID=UPI0020A77A37|nr:hypothetical protein [Mesorhizobium ventifaucium]
MLNDAANLTVTYAITIAGVTGTKIIMALEGNAAFVDTACDVSVAGGAVAHAAHVFKNMPPLAA